ncbi:MAG: MFS transporter, partial [Litorimonas sp.]
QSLNAMYIVFLGPVFAGIWAWLAKRGKDPSAPFKFGLGVIQLGIGFLVLVWGANSSVDLTPVLFIFLIYLLHTTGELCLSPVGLSAMTRLTPGFMVGLMMGAWFLASAGGNSVSAIIAQATNSEGGGVEQVLSVYSKVGWLAIGIGIVLLLISPFVKKLMHLDTLEEDTARWETEGE